MKYAFIICEISIHVYMEPQLFQKPTEFGLVSDNDNGWKEISLWMYITYL